MLQLRAPQATQAPGSTWAQVGSMRAPADGDGEDNPSHSGAAGRGSASQAQSQSPPTASTLLAPLAAGGQVVQLDRRAHALEKSIGFLKQQHRDTLDGLQHELEALRLENKGKSICIRGPTPIFLINYLYENLSQHTIFVIPIDR